MWTTGAHHNAGAGRAQPGCAEVLEQLWDYLDRELTAGRMALIAAHLATCRHCYPRYDLELVFLRTVREALRGRPSAGERDRLRERVLATLESEGPRPHRV